MRFLLLMVGAVLLDGPATATVISVSQNGSVAAWGVPVLATIGQTLTAPADSQLLDFTFLLSTQNNGSGAIAYQAHVFAWDAVNSRAVGASLYSSATTTYTAPASGFVPVTFSPNITLTPNQEYVLFFSTSGLQTGAPISAIRLGSNSSNPYSGGQLVSLNNGDSISGWTGSSWAAQPNFDLAMTVNFADAGVPEPSTYGLCGAALAALGLLRGKAKG
jgi:hypothetical protein